MIAAARATPPAGYVQVAQRELTEAFHTKTPWTVRVYQSSGHDDETDGRPALVCLTGGRAPRTVCEAIGDAGAPFQSVASVVVEPLSARAGLEGLVVHASFAGPSYVLSRTAIWTYNGAGLADDFLETSHFDVGDQGEEARFASGALDGLYIHAEPAYIRPDETRWSDHRFSVSVYSLDRRVGSYLQVLQYVGAKAYPAERVDPHTVIEAELPTARRLLKAIYPDGPPH